MSGFKPCPCDSGLSRWAQHDARGIFLTFTCDKCHDAKMKKFRPEVLKDPNYEADEDIEEG